jgi:hypothetical protein
VHGGERFEAESAGDFLIRGGLAVALDEVGDEVENLFLPPGDGHGSSIANKKRIESEKFAPEQKSATGGGEFEIWRCGRSVRGWFS